MAKGKLLEALQLAGDNKMYQKLLIALISILWLSVNCIMLGQSYIYIDPVFTCKSTGEKHITEEDACPIINECEILYPQTITGQLKLYCNRENQRVIIQSMYALGSFVGLVLMNFLSDVKGRKFSTIVSIGFMIFGTIIQILGGLYNLTILLIISQLINGFGSYSLITLSYVLISDFCSSKYRQVGSILINSAWGFSTVLLGYLYMININWLTFLIWVLEVPLVLTAIGIFFILIESPYILMKQNKRKQCLKSFAKVCYFNKTQENLKKIQAIVAEEIITQQNQQSFKLVLSIVKKSQNLKPILFLTILHTCLVINYYGVAYAMSEQGGGYGINMIIAGVVQTISYFVLSLFVTKMRRVKGMAIYNFAASIFGFLFLIPSLHENYFIASTILGISRFFTTTSYTLLACIQIESFTVQIQSTAAGSIQALCMIGVLLAPVIVDFANNLSIDPIVLISIIILIIGIWPNLFLKQTLPGFINHKLKRRPIKKQELQDPLNPQEKSIIQSQDNQIIMNQSFNQR